MRGTHAADKNEPNENCAECSHFGGLTSVLSVRVIADADQSHIIQNCNIALPSPKLLAARLFQRVPLKFVHMVKNIAFETFTLHERRGLSCPDEVPFPRLNECDHRYA